MEELKDKPNREIQPIIRQVEKKKSDLLFKNVARHQTTLSLKNKREVAEKVDNKYRPNYDQVEKHTKLVPKFKTNENEHSFWYENSNYFKSNIDIDVDQALKGGA